MLGHAHAAGFRDGPRSDADVIARYFSMQEDKVVCAVAMVESAANPQILLLQNSDADAKVGAAVLYSSVWSKAYARIGNPYGRVHRDFHYQVMFSALAALVEVGCDRIRFENPMPGRDWRRDAYVCLLEATRNIHANLDNGISVWLKEFEYSPTMPKKVDAGLSQFNRLTHRPIGISLHILEGMNVRTVFVEKAGDALRMARGLAPSRAN